MNLDKWNNPPECSTCKCKHWGPCEKLDHGLHEKRGENGMEVTVVHPSTVPDSNKPDWQGTSRQTPKVNDTEVLKERY